MYITCKIDYFKLKLNKKKPDADASNHNHFQGDKLNFHISGTHLLQFKCSEAFDSFTFMPSHKTLTINFIVCRSIKTSASTKIKSKARTTIISSDTVNFLVHFPGCMKSLQPGSCKFEVRFLSI